MAVPAEEAARLALHKIRPLLGGKPVTLAGIALEGASWKITVEALEKESIPASLDVLGIYDVFLSGEGVLEGFIRVGLRRRGDTNS